MGEPLTAHRISTAFPKSYELVIANKWESLPVDSINPYFYRASSFRLDGFPLARE
jgi:hypothetical protein